MPDICVRGSISVLRCPVIALVLLTGCGSTHAVAQAEHQREVRWCKAEIYARSQINAIRRGAKPLTADSLGKRVAASWEQGTLEDSSFAPVPCRRVIP
jgi:hypothetical protein